MVDRLQSVSSLLGDEVVFSASSAAPGQVVPMVMAGVRSGKRAELHQALATLFADAADTPLSYSVSDSLVVVSASPAQLASALARLGSGAASPFSSAIAERYRRGAGWLMAIDVPAVATMAAGEDAPPPVELAALVGMKYVFLEQRAPAGAEENEVTLVFDGERKGMASWLADGGAGGVAEYLPADSLAAGYVSMREPWQLFQELTTVMMERNASFQSSIAKVDEKLGSGFIANLTAALGNEAAVFVNGVSVNGPRWAMVALAYNPPVIDDSLRTFMAAFNAELTPEQQDRRVVFTQESVGGRTWNTMTAGHFPLGVTWSFDAGYMVAASDRATAERAIATRHGGSQLVWSPEFLSQLPASAGMHPSGFAWLNMKGALGMFSSLAPSADVARLLKGRAPVLVVFDGQPTQIHAASRTRLPGLILNVMLVENLTGTRDVMRTSVPQ